MGWVELDGARRWFRNGFDFIEFPEKGLHSRFVSL